MCFLYMNVAKVMIACSICSLNNLGFCCNSIFINTRDSYFGIWIWMQISLVTLMHLFVTDVEL
jgi:hypothetical protein